MLVLSRERDQSIMIGEGANLCIVTVVDICSNKVKLGIQAHRDIPVHRREIWEAIERENKRAKGEE